MKITAKAPANIAFIKYWGKSDAITRIPLNNSISMNLSHMFSVSTVEFDEKLDVDDIDFLGEETIQPKEIERIRAVLDRVRIKAHLNLKARVRSKNNFPKATGIASSASGFAALSLSALLSAGVSLSKKELSVFSRLASGTACRSIPDGFVEWEKGTDTLSSYAYSLYPPDWWDVCDVVVTVSNKMKKVSSTDGHKLADTSPFYETRISLVDDKIKTIKKFLKERDFSAFGRLIEDEALNMHAICMTSQPPIIYWEPLTITIMKSIIGWRENGEVESYFTIDAGPSIHVICRKKDAPDIQQKLESIAGVVQVVANYPSEGARTIDQHLF